MAWSLTYILPNHWWRCGARCTYSRSKREGVQCAWVTVTRFLPLTLTLIYTLEIHHNNSIFYRDSIDHHQGHHLDPDPPAIDIIHSFIINKDTPQTQLTVWTFLFGSARYYHDPGTQTATNTKAWIVATWSMLESICFCCGCPREKWFVPTTKRSRCKDWSFLKVFFLLNEVSNEKQDESIYILYIHMVSSRKIPVLTKLAAYERELLKRCANDIGLDKRPQILESYNYVSRLGWFHHISTEIGG